MPKTQKGAKRRAVQLEKTIASLTKTLCAIYDLDPLMGTTWRDNMVKYYRNRLAELLLYQRGDPGPSKESVDRLSQTIQGVLDSGEGEF